MKKIYLMLAALSFFGSHAQLQNANWHFGDHAAVTFLPSPGYPTSISGSALESLNEGCASVSDVNGNLLFYTNGTTVWNAAHLMMLNGDNLNGNQSSAQGVVIIPRPDNPDRYYIVTIDGITGMKKGLYFSEVDMSTGLGQVIPGTKNQVLKNHLGVPIDENYNNNSEKLTSTIHGNNKEYWLVTQISGYIYSYKVASTGISFVPDAFSPAAVTIGTVPPTPNYGVGQLKISPDGEHIGLAYSSGGGISLGDFNKFDGTAVIDDEPISGQGYGLEFSSQSQYVYFSLVAALHQDNARTSNSTDNNSGFIYRINMKNRDRTARKAEKIAEIPFTDEPLKSNPVPGTSTNAFFGSFQLALNNKIYVTNMVTVVSPNSLTVINNPDNYTNPVVETFSLDITSGAKKLGLPQWVHSLNASCLNNITLTAPETLYLYEYKYADYIETEQDYVITENRNITLNAGNYITLGPNTTIMPGSVFHAFIEGCGYTEEQSTEQRNQNSASTQALGTRLALYPNPANTLVTLHAYNSQLQHIRIISLDGKIITDKGIDKTTDYSINVDSYSKGIYIVTVQTADGKTYTEKLVIE